MEEELLNKILESADKAEIRGEDLNNLLLWFSNAVAVSALLSTYEKGLIDIARMEDNEPGFEITEKGKQAVTIITGK